MNRPVLFLLCPLFMFLPLQLHAHSGGLDTNGCHAGSKPYHCHRSANEMEGNRLRCDLGSKSKECIGEGKKEGRIYVDADGNYIREGLKDGKRHGKGSFGPDRNGYSTQSGAAKDAVVFTNSSNKIASCWKFDNKQWVCKFSPPYICSLFFFYFKYYTNLNIHCFIVRRLGWW